MYKKPTPTRGGYIVQAEYFINDDPGIGNGTPITVDASGTLQPFTLNNLNPGDRVYIRIRDSYERWSAPAQKVYEYPPKNRGGSLIAAEYFINTDPGIGKGTPLEIDPFGNVKIKQLALNRDDRLYIRFKDSYGRWGPARWTRFTYQDIIAGEYKFLYKNGTYSQVYPLEMENHDDPTLPFFSALSQDTILASTSGNIDTILVRFKTDYILGNWFGFAFGEIPITKIYAGNNLPEKFELYQNYPNPFNPVTTIQYDVPKPSQVKIEIFNMLGQRVRLLIDKKQNPGRYTIQWDARNDQGNFVAAGLYICRMRAGDFVKSLKLILVK